MPELLNLQQCAQPSLLLPDRGLHTVPTHLEGSHGYVLSSIEEAWPCALNRFAIGLQLEDFEALKEKYALEKAAAEAKLAQERRSAQARLDKELAAATAMASAAAVASSQSRPTTSHRNAGAVWMVRHCKHWSCLPTMHDHR